MQLYRIILLDSCCHLLNQISSQTKTSPEEAWWVLRAVVLARHKGCGLLQEAVTAFLLSLKATRSKASSTICFGVSL